ncbi:cyclopropane-fatty-acyl-phospholipid synthase family protein [uncultured Roseibium sp.]|uniref:cyclopropane-fatty-acyl-phospholipid synthase family protein n=1 Tax=uncultured Roseibium sp. TaxID=1936171 RepID=UPI0032162253
MSEINQSEALIAEQRPPLWQRMICRWAQRISRGRLALVFADGREFHVEGPEPGPSAMLKLNNSGAFWKVLGSGSLGFARAHMDGDIDSPDMLAFLELALINEDRLHGPMRASAIGRWIARLRHLLNSNTRAGSKRNIAFHYDLGNAFYGHWLDRTMTYSSALYEREGQSLEEAQAAKYDRIISSLDIGPDDHVLEIGCGWGGFAEHAIRKTGCRVTGLTLSKEQADYARRRLSLAGLSAQSDIRLQDYRDIQGRFSRIVSIEMFEAVGEENWSTYFSRVRELLAEDGKASIQVITIDESRFRDYRRGADFIQTYVFPGGFLPSVTAFEKGAGEGGLAMTDSLRFGPDYGRTLLAWDRAFTDNWSKIRHLGFDDRFYRMWRYYLHYCAAGFRSGRLDVVQFTLAR